MNQKLANITSFQSGIYEKPDILADTLYLQAVHFDEFAQLHSNVKPQLAFITKFQKHLLLHNDILFAAKGLNNFAALYQNGMGRAVASSSFIVIRLNKGLEKKILPAYLAWYITHDKKIKLMQQQQLGTTIPSISMKQLAEMEIDIPSIEKQEIILKVQELYNQEKQISRQLATLKDQAMQYQLSKATTE